MGKYTIDDGEVSYKMNSNIPHVKQKVYRKHKRVIHDIKRVWKQIRDIMNMYMKFNIGTNDLMKNYVRLFINQSRIKD